MSDSIHHPLRKLYGRFWYLLDERPLRFKMMFISGLTSSLAIIVLYALLAGTVGPQELGFIDRGVWLFQQFPGTGFIPSILVLYAVGMAFQAWLNSRATQNLQTVFDREADGLQVEPQLLRSAMDELAVFPLKAAAISLSLWTVTAILWGMLLNFLAFLPFYINLFIAFGIFCEGVIVSPYQYFMFKLLTERDYYRLLDKLDEPYFPQQVRFVTFRSKLAVAISIVLLFSLLALFASNTLLAWEGVKTQTIEVGKRLLATTKLGIESIRAEIEAQVAREQSQYDFMPAAAPPQPLEKTSLERVGAHLDQLRAEKDLAEAASTGEGAFKDTALDQAYFLFDEGGRMRYGRATEVPQKLLEDAVAAMQAHADASFLEPVEDPDTQDLFLAVPVKWVHGERWYLGTFYRGSEMSDSVQAIVVVSSSLIFVMIFVGLLTAFLLATDASVPLSHMARLTEKASEGDLTRGHARVISEDEVGTLARSLTHMLLNLREILKSIDSSTQNVDLALTDIEQVARQVSDGAEAQVQSSKDASEDMNLLSASIRSIEENVEVLTGSAEESSSSIFEMGSTIEEVATNVSQLFDAVDESTSTVTEMVASIRQVAESVETLRGITGETSAAMQEMTDAIRLVEQDAGETRDLSDRTAEDAQAGALSVQQTIEGIREIRKSVLAVNQVIQGLNESAEGIGNILNYIRDVADQTNLLSLNAGIIAAQAGEHGKGFAVIAKEVSTLAERTGRYTREIERLIENVQIGARDALRAMEDGTRAVETGVNLSGRAGQALEQILASAQRASQRVANIAATAADQSASAGRVSNAIAQVTNMAGQIANATAEQSRGSERILGSGERVREIAAQVKKTTAEQARSSKQITKAIENINDMVRYINESQREEVEICNRVSSLVEKINRVTLQNFDNAMNLDRALDVLRHQSGALKAQVARFQLSHNGGSRKPRLVEAAAREAAAEE